MEAIQLWYMSPSLTGVYTGLSLATTDNGEVLRWEDKAFENGNARFTQCGSRIQVILQGPNPDGCDVIDLIATRIR